MLLKPQEWLRTENKLLHRPYIGTVISNNDPKKMQRIKVRIDNLLIAPPADALWVYKSHAGFLGGSANSSTCAIPEMGSKVVVTFPTGDINYPEYTARPYPETEIEAIFSEDYPNTYGFKDSKGNWFRINKTQEYIELMHSSGSNIKIVKDGTINITSVKDVNIKAESGNVNVDAININHTATGFLTDKGAMIYHNE